MNAKYCLIVWGYMLLAAIVAGVWRLCGLDVEPGWILACFVLCIVIDDRLSKERLAPPPGPGEVDKP